MTQRVNRSIQSLTTEDHFKLHRSQTIAYDAGAITALIVGACGLPPHRGTAAEATWRVHADRIFNHELDLLRAASGASAGQTVTFKPIAAPAVAGSSNDPDS
jgi:hypothetical protein